MMAGGTHRRCLLAGILAQVVLITLVGTTVASAQVAIPPSAEVGQVEKRFQPAPEPMEGGEIGLPIPGAPKGISKERQAKLSRIKFVLKEVQVDGATVFSKAQLEEHYSYLYGEPISLMDANRIAQSLTKKYQDAGYVLSQAVVPQQEMEKGVLHIRVIEGFVGSVVIEGEVKSEGERALIRSYLDNVLAQKPVTMAVMERNLLLIKDLPGVTVKGLLRPSPGQFGAAELVVTLTRTALEASFSLDNRGSKYIGPWQYSGVVAANSLFGLYDRTQLRLTTSSPTSELRSFELQHEEMLGNQGTKLTLLASRSETQPGDSLKTTDIVGVSDSLEAKLSHPFIRTRQQTLTGRVLFDFHNSTTDVFHDLPFTEDRLRVLRAGGSYNFVDRWLGNDLLDVQAGRGLNIFNATDEGTHRTNTNGVSDFTKVNVDVSHLHPLPNNFSLFAAASGQYSFDPLLVSEQFALGGSNFGVGYDPSEVLGDQGIAGKIELRYSRTVGVRYFNAYQLFGSYDIGRAWILKGGQNANDKRSLSSLGMGIRTSFTEMLSGSLEAGLPLTKPASNQGDHGHDPRIFFGLSARY